MGTMGESRLCLSVTGQSSCVHPGGLAQRAGGRRLPAHLVDSSFGMRIPGGLGEGPTPVTSAWGKGGATIFLLFGSFSFSLSKQSQLGVLSKFCFIFAVSGIEPRTFTMSYMPSPLKIYFFKFLFANRF